MKTSKLALLTYFTLSSQLLCGATRTWTGASGIDNNWSTPTNWMAGAPVNGDAVDFPPSSSNYTSVNDIANLTLIGMTLDSATLNPYTITGDIITMVSSTIPSPPTISLDPTGGAAQQIDVSLMLADNLSITMGVNADGCFIDAPISGGFAVNVNNASAAKPLNLLGPNTYTGGTNINSGTVFTRTTSLPSAGGCSISNGSNLVFEQAISGTYSGAITGAGIVVIDVTSGGTITLSNTGNTYSGGTMIEEGTLMVTTSTLPAPGGCDITTSFTTLNFNQSFAGSYTGVISGSGIVLINGTGAVTLNNTNTYSGGTDIFDSGILVALADANMGALTAPLTLGEIGIDTPTLQAGASFTMTRPVQVVATTSRIDPNGNTLTHTTTNGGAATGSGGLHIGQVGGPSSPTTILNVQAPYSYTGGTTVDSGTLQLSGPSGTLIGDLLLNSVTNPAFDMSAGISQTIGALSGSGNTVLGANSLTVTINGPTAYSGSISGPGELIKQGTATFSLSGANTYTGGTLVSNGTLAVIGSGTLPNLGDLTLNSATNPAFDMSAGISQTIGALSGSGNTVLGANFLQVTITAPTAYSGSISGPGQLIKQGAGTLSLSGVNTYSAGTFVNNGTLAITGAGALPNQGPVAIISPGILDIAAAIPQVIGDLSGSGLLNAGANTLTQFSLDDTTFSGVMTGSGTFIHQGTNTLTLTGPSTFSGAVQIQNGTLKVNGILPANIVVEKGGTLKGTGTVGPVQNLGAVQPGGSIGTLQVVGDYTESGTLSIEVNDANQASLLAITGNIIINSGTTLAIHPDPGTYSSTNTFTVATFGGTRTGEYSTLTTDFPNRFSSSVIYDPHDIRIVLGLIPFTTMVSGSNARKAAKCFDALTPTKGSDLSTVNMALEALSNDLDELSQAFNQLQPSQFAALALAQENNDILVRSALSQRFTFRLARDRRDSSFSIIPKGSLWFEPVAKHANQQRQQHNHGYRQTSGGGLLGADYRIFNQVYVGGALGYTFTDLDWKGSAGDAHINSYYGALYGTWFCRRVFVDATLISAYNHYETKRHIKFPGIDRDAHNEHGGYELAGSLGTGLFFYPGQFQLQPYARADYVFVHQNRFKEHGADSIDLKVRHTDSRYARTDTGARLSRCFGHSTKFIPYVKASWIWEKQLDDGHLSASFIGSSCEFIVSGLHPVRSLFAPSIGFTTLIFEDKFSISAHYDVEVGKRFWEDRLYVNFALRY